MSGVTKTINMLQTQTCPKCRGKRFVNGGICPHCNGKGEETNYKNFLLKYRLKLKTGQKSDLPVKEKPAMMAGKTAIYILQFILKKLKAIKQKV